MPRIAQPDHPHPASPLACLVAGADGEHATHLVRMLERSARVGRVERTDTDVVLRHALAVQHRDLVVVVLDAPDRLLPASLLRYPETRVLVVAPDGVRGTLSRWLQQGANDLVSPHDEDALGHALGRLVDECALAAGARRLEAVVAAQRRRIETLTARLEGARGAAAGPAPVPRGPDASGYLPGREEEREEPGDAELDPSSRLPARAATLAALERLRAAPGDGRVPDRLTALQVVLPAGSVHDRLDRTLADLAVCRAADVIGRVLPTPLVLGRTRRDTLLVVCAGGPEDVGGADAAARLAARLGSLGELVERAGDLRVDLLTGTRDAIATAALAERLERRAHQAMVADAALATLEPDDLPTAPARVPGGPGTERVGGTRAATRYIGGRGTGAAEEPALDDSLVPILTRKSATARFERPAAGA